MYINCDIFFFNSLKYDHFIYIYTEVSQSLEVVGIITSARTRFTIGGKYDAPSQFSKWTLRILKHVYFKLTLSV